ncbi:MAG: restriction endonuclease subunit S [Akkermansia sp.]|nr:restriction endonuclease subunit S [Akkermansia sp.]
MKVKLGDVCEINPKRTPEDLSMNVSFIPMQSVSEQGDIDTSDIRSIKEVCKGFTAFVDGDVLMAKITPCMENGKGAIASGLHNGIGYGSTEFHVLRPNRDLVRSGWIYYFTKGKLFRINCEKNMTGSAGQKRVPKSYLQRYPIPLPSLAEQDKKITLLNRLRQIIILYKSQLQKLDELVKSRFMEQFGEKDYPLRSIGEISDVVTKGTTPTTLGFEFVNAGVNFVKVENITTTGQILKSDLMHITSECHEKLRRSQLSEGDILFSIAGAIGRTAVVSKDILPANTNQALAIIRLKKDAGILKTYLLAALSSPYVEGQYNDQKKGIAQINLTLKNISDLMIPIPPQEKQEQFAAFVRQIDKSKFAVRQALDKTQQLFDSLMQEYFG